MSTVANTTNAHLHLLLGARDAPGNQFAFSLITTLLQELPSYVVIDRVHNNSAGESQLLLQFSPLPGTQPQNPETTSSHPDVAIVARQASP